MNKSQQLAGRNAIIIVKKAGEGAAIAEGSFLIASASDQQIFQPTDILNPRFPKQDAEKYGLKISEFMDYSPAYSLRNSQMTPLNKNNKKGLHKEPRVRQDEDRILRPGQH